MTPFNDDRRTATISLTKQQEEIVRLGPDWNNTFHRELVQHILAKLRSSLRSQDVLLGPVGSNTKVDLLDF